LKLGAWSLALEALINY